MSHVHARCGFGAPAEVARRRREGSFASTRSRPDDATDVMRIHGVSHFVTEVRKRSHRANGPHSFLLLALGSSPPHPGPCMPVTRSVANCTSKGDSGAFYFYEISALTMIDSTFSNCSGGAEGGALTLSAPARCTALVRGCTFNRCAAGRICPCPRFPLTQSNRKGHTQMEIHILRSHARTPHTGWSVSLGK